MRDDPLSQAVELRAKRQSFVLATVVACRPPTAAYAGARAIIRPDGAFSGWVGGSCAQPIVVREALKAIDDGSPRLLRISPEPPPDDQRQDGVYEFAMPCESQGALDIYIEPFLPQPELLVIGETPLAQALARAGSLLDFSVCVSDPGATQELFPDADALLTELEQVPQRITSDSYVVVATQGHYDEDALAAVLRSPAAYVGLVASKRRAEAVFAFLRDQGIEEEAIARVRCPAGLSLGGVTPSEIAFSIAAEMLQVRRQRPAAPATTAERAASEAPPLESALSEASDPVCGMTVEVATARHTARHEMQSYYFCSARCRESFQQEPERYLAALQQ